MRGTSAQASSLSTRTSPGRPSTRSPRMLRITSDVPPSMVLARDRRNAYLGWMPGPRRPVGRVRSYPAS